MFTPIVLLLAAGVSVRLTALSPLHSLKNGRIRYKLAITLCLDVTGNDAGDIF